MKLLYISYWGIDEALTAATVFPNLEIVRPYFSEMYLATVERSVSRTAVEIPTDIIHVPFYSASRLPRFLEKTFDFIFFSFRLFWLIKSKKIDVVICRGSMAAAFGIFLRVTTRAPLIVESFEPHSDYMVEGSTWRKDGIEHKFQKWVEAKVKKIAWYLLPVTHNYANYLVENGVSIEKVKVMPCCVDIVKFSYREAARQRVRMRLGLRNEVVVGIYVGKFGDIYLKEEAFHIFRQAQDFFERNFFLIILSPHPKDEISTYLSLANFDCTHAHIESVSHNIVPEYLSAADFAFSLIRPSPSRKFCSPIKNGEYWANGLPVLLTKGVGDDDQIIVQTHTGAILDLENDNLESALGLIKTLLSLGRHNLSSKISPLAIQYRNFDIISKGYSNIFSKENIQKSFRHIEMK